MAKALESCVSFCKKEIVLSVAAVLALISMIFIPPSFSYISYIDWNTMALLFSLMAVVKGFQEAGLFETMGNLLLTRTDSVRKMLSVLVFLPFVSSMVITNDVALITFVPFGMIVLRMAKQERLMIPLVVMQTIAANLGSIFTPMGNPQNLYLYTKSGISFGHFCLIMLPYMLISALGLALLIFMRRPSPIKSVSTQAKLGSFRTLACSSAGFVLCIMGLFKIIPPVFVAILTAMFLLIKNRQLLAKIDYSLLGTFFALFIFIGNIGCIDGFRSFISEALYGHEELVSVLTSQIISNVPAALLLSGITIQWKALIVGCNLGGLGTLIASMASLISYKIVAKEYPSQCKKYFATFTLYNVCFLAVLLVVSFWLQK